MKKDNIEIYVLDTSAILTYLEDEDGAGFVEHLLIKADNPNPELIWKKK